MIKSKVIASVSLAVALGATATGGSLLIKPTITNKTVYASTTNRNSAKEISKNNQEINVTMYVFNSKWLKKFETPSDSEAYYKLNEQNVSFKEFTEGNPLGQATIKDYKGNNVAINLSAFNDINNGKERVFPQFYPQEYMKYFNKIQTEIPVGTKLNVLWASGNTVGVEYKDNLAIMSKNYLNTTGVPLTTNEIINTFAGNKNEQYIGTAITQEDPTGAYPAVTYHPEIEVLLNGVCYTYSLKPGTKVNVISESKFSQDVNTPILNSNGDIVNYVGELFPYYEKVEYNGIVGYMRPETLKPINYN